MITMKIDKNTRKCVEWELENLSKYGRNETIRQTAKESKRVFKLMNVCNELEFLDGYDNESNMIYNVLLKYDFYNQLDNVSAFTEINYPVVKGKLLGSINDYMRW